jgi:LacI family transcriptional regulator
MIAISALKAFDRLSLKVPQDVAIIGYDGIDLAEIITPSLTTLQQPQSKIAEEVAALMVRRIRGEGTAEYERLIYEPELIVRDSA